MSYEFLKTLHMSMATLLGLQFIVRSILLLSGSSLQQKVWLRIMPHLLSTVLIIAGIMLTVKMGGVPAWVWLKFALLFVFLIASGVAFKRVGSKVLTCVWLSAALLAYVAAMVLAVVKSLPWY
jgi:uncharacterized membrane protein SirB2